MIYILFEDRKTAYFPINSYADKDDALSELIDIHVYCVDKKFILKRMKNKNKLRPSGIMSTEFKYYIMKKYSLYVCKKNTKPKKIIEELTECPKTMKRLNILSSLQLMKKNCLKKLCKDNKINISPYVYIAKKYYLRALYGYNLKLKPEEYNDYENIVLNDDTIVLQ